MQLAPHGRLTRGGFSGSDGLLLPRVVNERRVRERVGERRAVLDRDGMAIALDHLLQPLPQMAIDPVREEIDAAFASVLRTPPLDSLRQALAREPIISMARL